MRAASSRTEFLASRLQIPRGPRSALERSRISDALGNSQAGVVLVVAPAGYGKTAAVAQWASTSPDRIAWLSLDADDNDSGCFWASLAEALKRADPALLDHTPAADRTRVNREFETLDAWAAPMLNRLAALDHEIVLVLDDYHEISEADGHAALAHLLGRRPMQLRVVVCSRSRPPIELGRLRSSGDLVELDVEQLAFTREETGTFLNEVLQLDLAETAVDHLHERTEGWPAGLFLASLSLASAADRDRQVAGFGAANRHVADYLAEEVLASAGDERRQFLLQTSILERLCAEVCDGTRFRHDSRGMLSEIVAANLFLLPLDEGGRWFRYHPLFREFLLAELHRAEPESVAELYGRASDWHAAAGSADEAVRYAIRAGDVPGAATLIGERWLDEVNAGRFRTVESWLGELPPDVLAGDVGLSMIRAWVARLLDLPQAADAAIADAEHSPTGNFPLGATSFEASVALIRAAFPGGDAGGMLEAARTAYELETDPASPCHGSAGMLLGWALRLNGDTPSARQLFAESATLTMRAGQWFDAYGARAGLAWCSLDDGDLDHAERWARSAVKIAREHDLVSTPHGFLGDIVLGAVLGARGRYDEADRLIANALDVGRPTEPFVRIQALLALVPVRNALLGPRAARIVLADARALLADCVDAGILAGRARDVARSITPAYRYVDTNTQLTQRELDVLRSLGEGHTKREIASTLFLSFNTIHSHTRTIYRKLGVSSRPEAIEVARLRGLLEGETVTAAGQLA